MTAITLDQFFVFVAIVEEGSFAGAARRMNRAQSAVTYAIQKLEEQTQLALFDRSGYRPELTEAGHALLPRARRILAGVADYRLAATGMAEGLEAEVCVMIDPLVPMELVVESLKAFHVAFPLTRVRVSIEPVENAVESLAAGWADVAVLSDYLPLTADLERDACGVVELVAVAAPEHPLAAITSVIDPDQLRDHVQLVLTTRSSIQKRPDFGILAVNRWYLTDLDTKHAMLLAGLGWGSMPRCRVTEDLLAGRLVELSPARWDGLDEMPRFPFVVAYRRDRSLGRASRWLVKRLTRGGRANLGV